MTPNKMQGHFWHQFLTQFSMPFHMVPSVLLSMVAIITTYFKESDWLLKNFHQSENGLKSYHGEQNRGYHMNEHKNLSQKQVSKVTLHFVWGQLSRKQTVTWIIGLPKIFGGKNVKPHSGNWVKTWMHTNFESSISDFYHATSDPKVQMS